MSDGHSLSIFSCLPTLQLFSSCFILGALCSTPGNTVRAPKFATPKVKHVFSLLGCLSEKTPQPCLHVHEQLEKLIGHCQVDLVIYSGNPAEHWVNVSVFSNKVSKHKVVTVFAYSFGGIQGLPLDLSNLSILIKFFIFILSLTAADISLFPANV